MSSDLQKEFEDYATDTAMIIGTVVRKLERILMIVVFILILLVAILFYTIGTLNTKVTYLEKEVEYVRVNIKNNNEFTDYNDKGVYNITIEKK